MHATTRSRVHGSLAIRSCRRQTALLRTQKRFASSDQVIQPAAVAVSSSEIASARNYCLDVLRKYDTPSSLLLPYIPSHARDAYVAIRAFNVDVARTADTTSTPTIGAMRLQFQRDAIAKSLAGTPPKQPIALLLARAADALADRTGGKIRFSKSWFTRLVDAREARLANPPFPDLAAVERYAENTYSTLLYLTLQALPMTSVSADHVASHIGKAAGIVAVLRGLPLLAFPGPANAHSNQGSFGGDVGAARPGAVMLPLDVMADAGVREEDVLRNGAAAHGLRDAVFTVATRANDHLITARQMMENIRAGREEGHEFEHGEEEEHAQRPLFTGAGKRDGMAETAVQEVERAFGVFMPAIAAQIWLDRLQKVDFDVFQPKLRVTDWKLPWKAYWGYNRRQI